MTDIENAPPEPVPQPQAVGPPSGPDPETRRRAAAVLEVLGGAQSPPEAAEALSISLPRYYLLEARALEGLVAACEPRPRGKAASPGKTMLALRRENDRLRQDLSRTQALARAIQRAAGVTVGPGEETTTPGRQRKRRRPRARALRAAQNLTLVPSLPTASPAEPSRP